MTDMHHIKTYLVFFFVSCLLVGVLAYLYMPGSFFGVRSDVLSVDSGEVSGEVVMSSESTVSTSSEVSIDTDQSSDNNSQKRLRLTNLLLHYQSELTTLESKKDNLSDIERQQKIFELRLKIDNLQTKITDLSH